MSLSEARRKLLGRLQRRKTREREALFLVEGVRSAAEAVAAGAPISFAVISPRLHELEGGEPLARRLGATVETHQVEDEDLARLSATETPQGILLVCRETARTLSDLDEAQRAGEPRGGLRLLVVDGVQDPGNLGTLVRAAAAFALSGVIVLDGTVDPFNPKAVRGAAGSLFRIPLVRSRWTSAGLWLAERGVRLLVGDPSGDDVGRAAREAPWALVVGSEGGGASEAVRTSASERVAIPMPGGTESLNAGVAGAILLYALTREDQGG
jgi:TrmH family RNA methyltransferase